MKFKNSLYYGDNLDVMKELLQEKGSFIDLIYIDPPFNSKRNYNILFKDNVQIEAFDDTWSNYHYEENIEEIQAIGLKDVSEYLSFIEKVMPSSYISYLSMMAIRIHYMRELLKDTGSFYLHCDPTMSHYLKTLCDLIFGKNNYRNEIVWSYQGTGQSKKGFKKKHDIIHFYIKTDKAYFSDEGSSEPISDFSKSKYKKEDEYGLYKEIRHSDNTIHKQYLRQFQRIRDVWELPVINAMAKERLGYPTQKPLSLLERIVKASSKKGDIVADFFCGCGTTIDAANSLKRKWLGVDISTISVSLIERRLQDRHVLKEGKHYEKHGFPRDIEGAKVLADKNKFEFQNWAVHYLAKGTPNKRKTRDKGIDGWFYFKTNSDEANRLCILQVKGGHHLNIDNIRAFINNCKEDNKQAGVFMTMGHITKGMKTECYREGKLISDVFKCDIVSIEDLMNKKEPSVFKYNSSHEKNNITKTNIFTT